MLHTYALSPKLLRKFFRRTFWRLELVTTISFLVFGIYLALLSGPIHWLVAGPIVVIIALAYFFIIFFNYRQHLRILYSVRYEIDGSSISYRQVDQEPMRIMRADILQVEERRNSLWVETVDPRIHLVIPYGLARDGDAVFYSTLQAWAGIAKLPGRRRSAEFWIYVVGVIAALLILLFANSFWIIVPLGVFLFVYGMLTENRFGRGQAAVPGIAQTYNMAFSFLILVILMKSCLLGFALVMVK